MHARQLAETVEGITRANRLPSLDGAAAAEAPGGWGLDALRGRFVEVAGATETAALTLAADAVAWAQRQGEWAAWVGRRESTFFPPDLAAAGVDLDALAVVHAPDAVKAARAAEALLRSSGFGVVVLDLAAKAKLAAGVQSRLAALAEKHGTALVCLTRKAERAASLGPRVSVRGDTVRRRAAFDRFVCELRVTKDRHRAAGAGCREVRHGPDGLC